MKQGKDALETAIVLLKILQRIPRGSKVTASQIQRQLAGEGDGYGRDIRTIQRHLNELCRRFDDIEQDDRSKPYGYRWKENARGFSVPMLSAQESLLLQLAHQHLQTLLPPALLKSMEGFFSQARANLAPPHDTRLERQWLEKVRVVSDSQPLLPPAIVPGVLETVSAALYDNHWLDLDYRNSTGKRNRVRIMPLGLAQQAQRMYLVCRYEGYDNERSLALHRILDARNTALPFERPPEFNLKKYDDDGRFGFGEGALVRLSFSIDQGAGQHLEETPLSKDQKMTLSADGSHYRITATVVDSGMLDWWLRGFGDSVWRVRKKAVERTA